MSRIAAWITGVLLIAACFMLTGAPVLLALLAMIVLLPGLTALPELGLRRRMEAVVTLPANIEKGQAAAGAVRLVNRGMLPAPEIRCRLRLTNDMTGESVQTCVSASLGPGESVSIRFELETGHCGRLRARVEKLWLTDWTGLIRVPCAAGATAKAAVLPRTFPVQLSLTVPPRTPEDAEAYAPDRRGDDPTETFQLRDYVPGDNLRQIHWKLSSKLDHVVVREPAYPVARSVLVFWDKSAAPAGPDKMDAMAEALLSLCQGLCAMGLPYQLAWYDDAQYMQVPIENSDDLCRAAPGLVRSGGGSEAGPGVSRYVQSRGSAPFGRILYVAAGYPADFGEFSGKAEATMLLCADPTPDTPVRTIFFSAADYAEQLRRMELDG